MDLPKEKAEELLESESRRNFLKAAGGLAAVVGIASGQLNGDNQGNISGGTMALEEAYRISDKQWIGPDSAKANVEAKSGRLYKAVDTEVEYYGDSGSWTGPLSVGSSSQPVPSVSTDDLSIGPGFETAHPDDNTSGIQAAIDAVESEGGGVVQLLAGKYVVENPSFDTPSINTRGDNVALVGVGRATHIRVPDNADIANDEGVSILNLGEKATDSNPTTSNGCVVANLRIDGNQQNNNGEGDGNSISNSKDGHNIEITGSNNKVSNVWSENATGDGLELTSKQDPSVTQNITVTNCHFLDCWEHCLHIHGTWGLTVANCTLDGEYNQEVISTFTDKTDNRDITITGCNIRNGSRRGVEISADQSQTVDGTQTRTREFELSDCLVKGHADVGVFIDGRYSQDVTLDGVRVVDCGGSGTHGIVCQGAEDVSIRGGVVRDCQQSGIQFQTNAHPVEDATVSDVTIKDNNRGGGSFHAGVRVIAGGDNLTRLRLADLDIIGDEQNHGYGVKFEENTAATYTDVTLGKVTARGVNSTEFNSTLATLLDYSRNNTPAHQVDVRALKSEAGNKAYHDGTNTNTVGPAVYRASVPEWTSLVDGTTIS